MSNSFLNNLGLEFNDEQAMLLESAQQFCADIRSSGVVRDCLLAEQPYPGEVWQQMVELGWSGVSIAEEFGGSGLGIGSLVPVLEACGKVMLSSPLASTALAAHLLTRCGSKQQKKSYLPRLASGEAACLALLDNHDWGAEEIVTQLIKADDQWRLHGSKPLVMDAPLARLLFVLAQHNGEARFVILERSQLDDGQFAPDTLIDQTKRSASLEFTGTDVSTAQIISHSELAGVLQELHLLGALFTAAEATGSAAFTLDTTVEYLKTRKQFGRLIGSFQALKHPVVDILNDLNHCRSLLYHAATLCNQQSLNNDAEVACRMAKALASDTLVNAADRAVQFHGAMGFTYECDAQLAIRRAQWSQAMFGDAAHHRKRLAALLLDARHEA